MRDDDDIPGADELSVLYAQTRDAVHTPQPSAAAEARILAAARAEPARPRRRMPPAPWAAAAVLVLAVVVVMRAARDPAHPATMREAPPAVASEASAPVMHDAIALAKGEAAAEYEAVLPAERDLAAARKSVAALRPAKAPESRYISVAGAGSIASAAPAPASVDSGAAGVQDSLTLEAKQQQTNPAADAAPGPEDWISIFNGRNLDGWTPKIRGYPAGRNYGGTFRVVDGALTVAYDGYEEFDERFGHIFYAQPFSHYRVRFEYRFIGEQAPDAPGWAFRNSGIMLHSQDPATMGLEQDFPISIEFQLLGGRSDGDDRPTGNVCSPGTELDIGSSRAFWHCNDAEAPTLDGDQWVRAEALVQGSERVLHTINGQPVIEYANISVGGGMVSGHDPAQKHDGKPLGEGYLSLQSEGHPIQFRNIELLNLKGCMDPDAKNFKRYFVADERGACAY